MGKMFGFLFLLAILLPYGQGFPSNKSAFSRSVGVLLPMQANGDSASGDTVIVTEIRSLSEVTVTAFNTSRRLLDMPGSVSMIPPGRIERENSLTVLPLLNQASGVFAHMGTLNTSRITIRGIGARVPYATGKIRAYLNQIPLTNGSGISILEHIDPSVIERIEITKGPASSAYGAGLGGTVNITARQPFGRAPSIGVSTRAGSYGLLSNVISFDGGNDRLASSLLYSRTRNEGFRENNSYRRDALTSVTQWRLADRTLFTALVAWSDMKGHIPSSVDSMTHFTAPRSAAQNWLRTKGYEDTEKLLAGVSGLHRFSERFTLQAGLFSTLHNEKEMRPFDVLFEQRKSAGSRIKGSYYLRLGQAAIEVMGGAELFFEDFRYGTYENIGGVGVQGDQISDHQELIRTANFFLQSEVEVGRLNASAGLNVHTSRTGYSDLSLIGGMDRSEVYNYGVILSPRVSANYRYLPFQALFVTLSHGFSPPALSETLTPEGFVNPGIRPETSWSVEAGLRGNLWGHRVFYDLSAYRMRVEDLLVAERVGADAWVGKNAGESVHRGLEAEIQLVLLRDPRSADDGFAFGQPLHRRSRGRVGLKETGSWWRPTELSLRPVLTVNHFRFTDFVDRETDYSGNQVPGIPALVLGLGADAGFAGGLYAQGHFHYVGEMPMDDANSRYTEAYALLDLTAGYQGTLRQWHFNAFVKVNNMTNQHYASMILVNAPSFGNNPPRYYYPGMPRHFMTGLKIHYYF